MMVNTFWRGDTTKVILLQVLVANSLLHFSSVTGDAATCNTKSVIPEVKIFSSPPNRTQPIAAAINLTCEARPRDEDVLAPRKRVKYIQWYDPHGRPVGVICLNPQSVKKLKCSLILKNLTVENFGNYTCEAENDYAGYCRRKSIEILPKVILEVKIFSSPPNRTQPIAAAINLTCEAWPKYEDESNPKRRVKYIQWYDTHGRQIGDKCLNPQLVKKLKCPLILKNLTIENFGNYTCEAENDYAGYCTRKSVEILHKGNNQIIPNTNKFDHENLSPLDTTKAPHLPEVVENPKNQSAFIGSNVTFNCTAMGLPTPAISWMKNNNSYAVTSNMRARVVSDDKNNHSQLIITEVKIEDNGKYQCVASNSAGERTSSAAFLYIKELENLSPPETTKAPQLLFPEVVENPKNHSAFIGSNVTFNCTAMGLPTPAISWMKNNNSYAVTSNMRARVVSDNKNNHSQLIITEVKIEDNGKYQCVASNSAGERTSSAAFLYIKELESKINQESEKEKCSTSPHISFSTLSYAIIATFLGTFIGGICVGFWFRTIRRRGKITFHSADDCEKEMNEFKQIK